jgi:hypothetical protein
MSLREREGLVTRIRHLRRVAAAAEQRSDPQADVPDLDQWQALEQRVSHLERLVEGLQDSVHRESERQAELIAELQEQVEPGAMGAALNKDARDRGLA